MQKSKHVDFQNTLRRAGYRATFARIAVLTMLERVKKPVSPHTVIAELGKEIDQATIYRILKALKKSGIIRQVDFRHNHPHYELADMQDHHHLICLSCGLSEEILGCDVDSMRQSMLAQAKQFGEVSEHSLEFYGICKRCLRKR